MSLLLLFQLDLDNIAPPFVDYNPTICLISATQVTKATFPTNGLAVTTARVSGSLVTSAEVSGEVVDNSFLNGSLVTAASISGSLVTEVTIWGVPI